MRKHKQITGTWLVALAAALALAACGGPKAEISVAKSMPANPSIAVVQLAVETVNPMHHTVPIPPTDTIAAVDGEVATLEHYLKDSGGFTVKPVSEAADILQGAATGSCPESWACSKGTQVFAKDTDSLMKGGIPPATATALCEQLGVDYVMGVFTQWWLVAGFKKQTKVKASYRIYNAKGEIVIEGTSQGFAPAGMFPAGPRAVQSFNSATDQAFLTFVQELAKK